MYIASENAKMAPLGKELNAHNSCDPAIPLLGIQPANLQKREHSFAPSPVNKCMSGDQRTDK